MLATEITEKRNCLEFYYPKINKESFYFPLLSFFWLQTCVYVHTVYLILIIYPGIWHSEINIIYIVIRKCLSTAMPPEGQTFKSPISGSWWSSTFTSPLGLYKEVVLFGSTSSPSDYSFPLAQHRVSRQKHSIPGFSLIGARQYI